MRDRSYGEGVGEFRGGRREAERRLRYFLEHNLRRYASLKNEPSAHATSGLSAYLHFGHISSLEVALAVKEYAEEHKLIAEEFLEELIVRPGTGVQFRAIFEIDRIRWRLCRIGLARRCGNMRRTSAIRSIAASSLRRRERTMSCGTRRRRELLRTGTIHGYYRMYWGKKIIEWSATHQEALATMISLHDKYALDGRDPNTYANILWCFGLHDRPWFERSIFGNIRYMALSGMRRKTDVEAYIAEHS